MFKCSGGSCYSVCVFQWTILVAGHIHCFAPCRMTVTTEHYVLL